MKVATFNEEVFTDNGKFQFLHDWYSASVLTGIYPHKFSYMRERVDENLKKMIIKKKREVYKSTPVLAAMQDKLRALFCELWETIPEEERSCVISYIKGVNPRDVVAQQAGAKCAISFDIRKYYDNISFGKIVNALTSFGMNHAGAKLMASYCVVGKRFLQQGSACSPVLSNIVGYHYFDKHIKKYLSDNYPELDIRYLRYCDNFVLFCHCDIPEDFYKKYKEFITELLKKGNFSGHKWSKVTNNNPKKNIQWLGIILNNVAKIDRHTFDSLRGEMFSMLIRGNISDYVYIEKCHDEEGMAKTPEYITWDSARIPMYKRYLATLRGRVAYINSINKVQGLMLQKLLALLEYVLVYSEPEHSITTLGGVRAIRTYKNKEESCEEYLQKFFPNLKTNN